MDFDFKFQPQYIGLWQLEEYPSAELSGTLFVEKQTMWIDLFFRDDNVLLPSEIEEMRGTTYTSDGLKNEEKQINVVLQHLYLIKSIHFGIGLRRYKYEVKELFIYDKTFEKNDVKEIRISSSIFDKWNSSILTNAFQDEATESMPNNQHLIKFVQPCPYKLCKTDIVNVYFYYGYSWVYGSVSQCIKQKAFLYLIPKVHKSFDEAQSLVKQYCWLLHLLMNRVFQTDHMVLSTSNGEYIYRISNKYAYHFLEDFPNSTPYTSLTDFSSEEILSIFSKWNNFYTDYQDAIGTFFETSYNLYLPPSSIIKNYISIIDAFTQSLKGDSSEINPNTKKAKTLTTVLEKTKDILTADEKNKLKTWLLYNKGTEMKPRFCKLLESMKGLIPENIDGDFVEKVVNTRNNITHPKDYEEYSFHKDQYEDVAYKLTKVIRAYILNELGVNENIIRKIVKLL